jgi:hypothetical protein
MFYRAESDQYINEGMPFEIDDVQYPANWLNLSTPEEKTDLGLEEVITVGERKDDRYYWVSESLNGAVLTITSTPKDLETVRSNCISSVRASAYSILLPSDWFVTRKQENGKEIPVEWTTFRENVRLEAERCVSEAEVAATVDEIAAITPNWPLDPNAPIITEDPVTDVVIEL